MYSAWGIEDCKMQMYWVCWGPNLQDSLVFTGVVPIDLVQVASAMTSSMS